ncbi:High affinity Ca2+/Mn2+ P-type ATPase-like protein, partial [Modicella reniformis]
AAQVSTISLSFKNESGIEVGQPLVVPFASCVPFTVEVPYASVTASDNYAALNLYQDTYCQVLSSSSVGQWSNVDPVLGMLAVRWEGTAPSSRAPGSLSPEAFPKIDTDEIVWVIDPSRGRIVVALVSGLLAIGVMIGAYHVYKAAQFKPPPKKPKKQKQSGGGLNIKKIKKKDAYFKKPVRNDQQNFQRLHDTQSSITEQGGRDSQHSEAATFVEWNQQQRNLNNKGDSISIDMREPTRSPLHERGGSSTVNLLQFQFESEISPAHHGNQSNQNRGRGGEVLAVASTPSASYARRTAEETALQLETNATSGLTTEEANSRRLRYGLNEFDVEDEESLFLKFLKSFYENPLILLLLASAVVSLAMGQRDDAISITLAILIVVSVAFVQEYRSEKSLEALNKLVPHHCHVIRDDTQTATLASQLIPGDLVKFGIGDRIPADCRLITAVDLEIDESNLTGENKPCRKQIEVIAETEYAELSITERKNIAFMGTLVRNGHGTGIVVGTSKETEFGVVFCMMQEVEVRKTPLQMSMDELGKKLSMLSFIIIGVIVTIGLFQGKNWLEMMTIGVSLAVAAIPEGLPIVVTVTLALGVLRMANRKAIIKKLPSVETLGSVNVVCADKTGTLTMNQMTVTKAFTLAEDFPVDLDKTKTVDVDFHPGLRRLLQVGNLCNNAFLDEHSKWIGQPTDIALIEILRELGVTDERPIFERLAEFPFNSDQKFMHVRCAPIPGGNQGHKQTPEHSIDPTNATVSQSGLPGTFYFKGAIEPVLERCVNYYRSENNHLPLDIEAKDKVLAQVNEMASHGLRVLAMAFGNDLERLTFVGIVAMHDPPRPGVEDSIRTLVGGGVKVIMITGDADATALSIARRLGFPINPGKSSCLTGPEIEAMTERQLQDAVSNVSVFARTTPKHKMAIVSAFQAKGSIVAMTGDGVNDAPALKLADIGISMGRSGTDVAKEAADMILVDDDFSTILAAVEEGKSIFYNIQNFLTFQLSTSVAALSLIAMATLFGLNNPLNAMQILWINILMDGPPAQSLGVEPVDDDVMKKPPRARDAAILTRLLLRRVLTSAMIIVAGTMFVYVHEMTDGSVTARDTTMTFTTFVFFDMFNALACRSEKKSIFSIGFTTNRMFNISVLGSIVGQFLVIYTPFFQGVFQTEALRFIDLVSITVLTSSVFWVEEARKFLSARNFQKLRGRHGGQGFKRVVQTEEEGESFEIV